MRYFWRDFVRGFARAMMLDAVAAGALYSSIGPDAPSERVNVARVEGAARILRIGAYTRPPSA